VVRVPSKEKRIGEINLAIFTLLQLFKHHFSCFLGYLAACIYIIRPSVICATAICGHSKDKKKGRLGLGFLAVARVMASKSTSL
jgi:hypothetical protein